MVEVYLEVESANAGEGDGEVWMRGFDASFLKEFGVGCEDGAVESEGLLVRCGVDHENEGLRGGWSAGPANVGQ